MKKIFGKAVGFILVMTIALGTAGTMNPLVVKAWDVHDTSNYDPADIDENGYYRYSYDTQGNHREGWTNGLDKDGWKKDGFNADGYDRDGYDKFGYDRDGYDREGYDHYGYDRSGYDKNGYDADGLDRYGNSKPHKKRTPSNDWKKVISSKSWKLYGTEICDKKDLGGDKIIQKIQKKIDQNSGQWDFEATIKPIAVKKGYGKYQIILTYGSDYKDTIKTTEFTIFPDFGIEWNPEKRTERLKQKKQYNSLYSTKAAFEHVDGFEYKVMVQTCKYIEKRKGNRIFMKWVSTGRNKLWRKGKIGAGKLVKFEKNYAGGEKEYQGKYYDNDCIISPYDTSKIVRIKFRPYINVNGNKIYGAWRFGKL